MTINLPADVHFIIETLEKRGHEVYAVGGCIRDALMGTEPKDWDICTSALPRQTMDTFAGEHIIETGIKHGTITLMLNQNAYEITTYRVDGIYSDNRRPDSVTFVRSLREDLSRRDITINALAYSPKTGVVDLFDGISDLRGKVVRCVGEADTRFREDALRILRALRFASNLGFEVTKSTSESIHRNKELLTSIASERIMVELNKLLCGRCAGEILRSYKDVFAVFIPELESMVGFEQNNPHHHVDVWEHTVEAVTYAPADTVLRLTLLLHDIAKPLCYTQVDGVGHFYKHGQIGADMAKDILRRLKYDGNTVSAVSQLVLYHDAEIEPRRKIIRRWLSRIGEERLRMLIDIKKADTLAQAPEYRGKKLDALDAAADLIDEVIEQRLCFSLKDLAVNGRDLMDAGITDGVQIGRMLNRLLEMVVDESAENDKEVLLHQAREIAEQKEFK